MKTAERVVMVAILFFLVGGGYWFYYVLTTQQQDLKDAVARGEYQIPLDDAKTPAQQDNSQEEWRRYYPITTPITIGSTTVAASVAETLPERIKGLSGTPYLPEGLVKLFVFGQEGTHAIWMKDMNYAIDIIWIAKSGEVIHIEESVAPETYPESFASPTPVWYVVEANAGFVLENNIQLGDIMTRVLVE